MRFRQINNDEVLATLTDPSLYVLFLESDSRITRRKVCKLLPTVTAGYVQDTRYMFGYFEDEDNDGGK